MSDDKPAHSPAWPLPRFYFQVEWGSAVFKFQEVSGLDIDSAPMENRDGDEPLFSVQHPGNTGTVTLNKGVYVSAENFQDWFNAIRMNTIARSSVTISLLEETGAPTMVWTLSNAWPTKITGAVLQASEAQTAIETIEISHEGLTIDTA